VLTECVGEDSCGGRRVLGHALRHSTTDELLPSLVHQPHALDWQGCLPKPGGVTAQRSIESMCTRMIDFTMSASTDGVLIWGWKLGTIDVVSNF